MMAFTSKTQALKLFRRESGERYVTLPHLTSVFRDFAIRIVNRQYRTSPSLPYGIRAIDGENYSGEGVRHDRTALIANRMA
jgi:hypothetical protein